MKNEQTFGPKKMFDETFTTPFWFSQEYFSYKKYCQEKT